VSERAGLTPHARGSRRVLLAFAILPAAAPTRQAPESLPVSPGSESFARIAEIVAFGERLGRPSTGNFARAAPEIEAIHILYACPRFELRRHYNEIYRTHGPDREAAQKAADVARGKGEDVRIETVEAVAEGSCPATRALLEAPLARQIYVVLHENAHVALRSDLLIEEPVADAIATVGSQAYFTHRFGPDSPEVRVAKRARARVDRLGAFVEEVYARLARVYETLPADPPARERLRQDALEEARSAFARLVEADGWDFRREELNNAFLTRQHTFALYRPLAFEAAAAFEGPGEAVRRLLQVPESEASAVAYLRALAERAPSTPPGPR